MQLFRSQSLFGLLVAIFSAAGAWAQSTRLTLPAQIHAIEAEHHGDVALFAENLKTHETVATSPDTPVQTASVIKLAILYEALEQVRSGKAHFDDRVTLTPADQVPGSGVLRLFDAPLSLTLKDVLTMMVVMSDNSATNLAIDHLGLENIDDRIAKLGLKDTYLYKKVFTPAPVGAAMPTDQKRFGLGKTTAREMATLMTKFVRCELAEPASPTRCAVRCGAEDAAPTVLPECNTAVSGWNAGSGERLDCEQNGIARCSAERCRSNLDKEWDRNYFSLHVQQ
jgi:beta-lactamase class A